MVHFLLAFLLIAHSCLLFCAEDSGVIPHVFLEKQDPNEYKKKYYDVRDFIMLLNSAATPEEIDEQLCKKPHLAQLTLSDFVKQGSPESPIYTLRHTQALDTAIQQGNALATALLIQKGASLEWRDQHRTPLIIKALEMDYTHQNDASSAARTKIKNLITQKVSCSAQELLMWIAHALNRKESGFAAYLIAQLPQAAQGISNIPLIYPKSVADHTYSALEKFLEEHGVACTRKRKWHKGDTLLAYLTPANLKPHKTDIYISSPLSRALEKQRTLKHLLARIAKQKTEKWLSPDLTPWALFAMRFQPASDVQDALFTHIPPENDCWAPYLVDACKKLQYSTLDTYCDHEALRDLSYMPLLGYTLASHSQNDTCSADLEKTVAVLIKHGSFIMARYPNSEGDYPTDIIKKHKMESCKQVIKNSFDHIFSHAQREQATEIVVTHLLSTGILRLNKPIVRADFMRDVHLGKPLYAKPPKLVWYCNSPAHIAAAAYNAPLMKVLFVNHKNRINPHMRNRHGHTPGISILYRLASSGGDKETHMAMLEEHIKKDRICPSPELAWHLNKELNEHCSRDINSFARTCIFGQLCKQYADIESMARCRFVKQAAPSWQPGEKVSCTTYFEEYAALHQLPLIILNPHEVSDNLSDEHTIVYLTHVGHSPAAFMRIQYPLSKAIDQAALKKVDTLLNNNHSVDVLVNDTHTNALVPLWVYAIKKALEGTESRHDRYTIAEKILAKKRPYPGEWAIQLAHALKNHEYELAQTLCSLGALKHNEHLPFIVQLLLHTNTYDDKKCMALLRTLIEKGAQLKATIPSYILWQNPDTPSACTLTPQELARVKNMPQCEALLARAPDIQRITYNEHVCAAPETQRTSRALTYRD